MPEIYDDVTLYSGSYKLGRLIKATDKILKSMGETIDLHTADFRTLEKLATLSNIEKKIESSVESYASDSRKAEAYKLLLRIKKNRPVTTGFLNKTRLFYLTNNTIDGIRLMTKTNLYYLMSAQYPHCFRYDENDVSDVWTAGLVNMLNFSPTNYDKPDVPVVVHDYTAPTIYVLFGLSMGITLSIVFYLANF